MALADVRAPPAGCPPWVPCRKELSPRLRPARSHRRQGLAPVLMDFRLSSKSRSVGRPSEATAIMASICEEPATTRSRLCVGGAVVSGAVSSPAGADPPPPVRLRTPEDQVALRAVANRPPAMESRARGEVDEKRRKIAWQHDELADLGQADFRHCCWSARLRRRLHLTGRWEIGFKLPQAAAVAPSCRRLSVGARGWAALPMERAQPARETFGPQTLLGELDESAVYIVFAGSFRKRRTGIEPASSAWKAAPAQTTGDAA